MGFINRGAEQFDERTAQAAQRGPRYYGDDNDPRYPSSRDLRTFAAVSVDVLLHFGVAFAVAAGIENVLLAVLVGVITYIAASFVHTVLFQRIFGATVGKLLSGVVLIRGVDGRRPTLWNLLRAFLFRACIAVLGLLADGSIGHDTYGDFLSIVRSRDVRALRTLQSATWNYQQQSYPPHPHSHLPPPR
ncbi:RDD family protein [Nocardia bhagyanarayanae]|uniref:RDD family protein n=1 Tax=Nocardia bhagyanarayanae TaxID=1215925 RepID=A0A543EVC0_9NOCA|nr:RDD family protein [Nocardia bhagyanarayanae]TQM25505.1 RDD family protein [Nocardia bhagyanarayanae]